MTASEAKELVRKYANAVNKPEDDFYDFWSKCIEALDLLEKKEKAEKVADKLAKLFNNEDEVENENSTSTT